MRVSDAGLSTRRSTRGAGLYLTLIGLLAVGLGFLVRSTAGAISTLVGILLVLPLLTNALPSPYSTDVAKYLPLNAGTQILTTTHPDPTMLGPWTGLAVTAVYALVALVVGAVTLSRRDAEAHPASPCVEDRRRCLEGHGRDSTLIDLGLRPARESRGRRGGPPSSSRARSDFRLPVRSVGYPGASHSR